MDEEYVEPEVISMRGGGGWAVSPFLSSMAIFEVEHDERSGQRASLVSVRLLLAMGKCKFLSRSR